MSCNVRRCGGSSKSWRGMTLRRPARESFSLMLRAIALLVVAVFARGAEWEWRLPPGFPRPVVPAGNPMTAEKVELGRHLFYDKRMSVNGTQSCGTCHRQELAFTDGKARAEGATGERHPRG